MRMQIFILQLVNVPSVTGLKYSMMVVNLVAIKVVLVLVGKSYRTRQVANNEETKRLYASPSGLPQIAVINALCSYLSTSTNVT